MIYKILPRKTPLAFGQLFKYIQSESKLIDGTQLHFTHNLRGQNEDEWIKEFLKNEAYRSLNRKNRTFTYHSILSFGKEPVSDDILKSVIQAYFKKRGNVLAFAGVHRDREHTHYHIIESATLFRQNKSSRLSHSELKELKLFLEDYVLTHHPELKMSYCEHGTGKYIGKDNDYYISNQSIKGRVVAIIQQALDASTTQDEFTQILLENDLPIYERKRGDLTGVQIGDRRFRFSTLGFTNQVGTLSKTLEANKEQDLLKEIESIRRKMGLENLEKER